MCDFGSAKSLPLDTEGDDGTSFDFLGNVIPSKEAQCPYKGSMQYAELPRTFTIIGTPHAMSPEVASAQSSKTMGYTMAADWWSFGVVLYEMLYGAPPPWQNRDVEGAGSFGEGWDWALPSHHGRDGESDSGDAAEEAEKRLLEEGLNLVSSLLTQDPKDRWEVVSSIQGHPFFTSVNWGAVSAGTSRPPHPDFDRRLGFIDLLEQLEEDISGSAHKQGADEDLTADQQALFEGY